MIKDTISFTFSYLGVLLLLCLECLFGNIGYFSSPVNSFYKNRTEMSFHGNHIADIVVIVVLIVQHFFLDFFKVRQQSSALRSPKLEYLCNCLIDILDSNIR